MAQRKTVVRVCDMPGPPGGDAENVRFGLDGEDYEIDMCAGHEEQLRSVFRPYLAAARPVRAAVKRKQKLRRAPARRRAAAQRAWAREHGFDVADRGRLPADALEAWRAAQ